MADDIEIEGSVEEGWAVVTDDPDVFGVEVSYRDDAGRWAWEIFVNAAEFVRDEPFESTFRSNIERAIRGVRGITEVAEEDREVWLAAGDASGPALTRAVATAVEAMADDIEDALEDG